MNTSIEQQLAIYRRDRKRILRANYQRPLAMLGAEAQEFMETVWASQLNSRAALCMLEMLRVLQANHPELDNQIEACLREIGIPNPAEIAPLEWEKG